MAKFDLENVMDGVTTFLQNSLNTQITALNTEKNDGITLGAVNSSAYHLVQLKDRLEINDPFILVDEAGDPKIESNGGLAATVHSLGVTLFLADPGLDLNMPRRLLRYRRCLWDVCLTNWSTLVGSYKFSLNAWRPIPVFKEYGDGTSYNGHAVGIVLSVGITD